MPADEKAARPLSKPAVLLRRALSSAILWTVVLVAIFAKNRLISDYFFLFIVLLLAGAGLVEFYDLVSRRGLVCFKGWGVFGGLLLIVSTFVYLSPRVAPAKANDFETSLLILFVLGLCL